MIVFVCTGNICRSPLAEAMARQLERRHGSSVEFSSAGINAVDGLPATPEAVAVGGEVGVVLRWHRSRSLTDEIARSATLMVALDDEHLDYITERFPDAAVELLDRVPDPYGMSEDVYRAVRDQIGVALDGRAGRWLSAD